MGEDYFGEGAEAASTTLDCVTRIDPTKPRLSHTEWRRLERAHQARVDALTAAHLARRSRGERHPVEDFLWTYYSVKPAELRRWHPGAGVLLEDGGVDRQAWRHYAAVGADITVDLDAFFEKRGATVTYVDTLLRATLERTPRFGCFGLHEWAMVYRLGPEQVRHAGLPLRIGHEATDRVVESHRIACTHFDAYRFFTPEASPLNTLRPTRETQPRFEQPACLHAGMDVYKWAYKLAPFTSAELIADCFALAREIRELDMRASPYDLREWGYSPVAIETAAGKAEYVAAQRVFATRAGELRRRLIDVADAVLAG